MMNARLAYRAERQAREAAAAPAADDEQVGAGARFDKNRCRRALHNRPPDTNIGMVSQDAFFSLTNHFLCCHSLGTFELTEGDRVRDHWVAHLPALHDLQGPVPPTRYGSSVRERVLRALRVVETDYDKTI